VIISVDVTPPGKPVVSVASPQTNETFVVSITGEPNTTVHIGILNSTDAYIGWVNGSIGASSSSNISITINETGTYRLKVFLEDSYRNTGEPAFASVVRKPPQVPNQLPVLSHGNYKRESGMIIFSVNYNDPDGDPNPSVYVNIDGTDIKMRKEDASSTVPNGTYVYNYPDDKLNHTFYFHAYDRDAGSEATVQNDGTPSKTSA